MTKREEYIDTIVEGLSWLSRYIDIKNDQQRYDVNHAAETIFEGLLNLIYGYNLENGNTLKANMPVIDLFDCKNRIAVQVTSDTSLKKIRDTLTTFKKREYCKKYDRLIILYISKKAPRRKNNSNLPDAGITFCIEKDVWDCAKIVKDISVASFSFDKLRDIAMYMEKQLGRVRSSSAGFIKTPLKGRRYVAEYIQELLTVVFDSWKNVTIKNLGDDIIIEPSFFETYYDGRLRRNLNIEAYEKLVLLFSKTLLNSFKNDLDYAVIISDRLNKYFSDALGINTEHLVICVEDGYSVNHNRVLLWRSILFEVLSYWRKHKEQFLIGEVQAVCNDYMSLQRNSRHFSDIQNTDIVNIQKASWTYNICIIDDDDDFRQALGDLLLEKVTNHCPYECEVSLFTNGNSARVYARERNFDVIVLDVINEKNYKQIDDSFESQNIYFGADFINLILKEKPDAEVQTKFYVYSLLPKNISMSEFNGLLNKNDIDITYLSKDYEKKNFWESNYRIVDDIISYLNDLYINDISPL